MRFGLIHRIMTDALATLGLLALVTSGELNRWMSFAIVAGMVAALLVPERWQDRPLLRQLAVTAPIAGLGLAWALAMGIVGGLLPAVKAARLPVTEALRAT